ncbi:hypothetical protein AK812_SmicGene20495 [Symbiodinium microadriaticum]|uniref:Uncharacterized protein n=1 Tax=Symbiodinium microadriaticum TaxID=2951 RepID=A0A1Q9DPR3_SYMMI|nr:hypothetical protein AK812_SmicGene20495 [Symbiodinium microadriaticum]
MCACAVGGSALVAPEDKVEDQLSTRTASSSSFPRTGSSRDEESPGQSSGSAAAALFAAVLVATGREAKEESDVQPDGSTVKPVKQLQEALEVFCAVSLRLIMMVIFGSATPIVRRQSKGRGIPPRHRAHGLVRDFTTQPALFRRLADVLRDGKEEGVSLLQAPMMASQSKRDTKTSSADSAVRVEG